MRMMQRGAVFYLAKEALRADGLPKLAVQNLERDLPLLAPVAREEDDRGAAAAELALDGVSSGDNITGNRGSFFH